MSEENIDNITRPDSNFALNYQALPDINFNRHCLVKTNISIHKKVINLYIYYILNPWLINLNIDFTLNNCLFGSAELTKNADTDE